MQGFFPTVENASSSVVPDLPLEKVAELVGGAYGIVGGIEPLPGERDQNCRIETTDRRRYVVKISNPSEPFSVVDFQIAGLDHIARISPDQPVPRVIRTLDGQTRLTVKLPNGMESTLRVLTYLEGIQVRDTACTAAQRRAMGTLLARLDHALGDFTHPAAAHEGLLWNVSAAHRLIDKLDVIVDAPRRTLAEFFMERFTKHVLPRLDSVRAQVIHNDYHLYNVLVAPEANERIVGVIDFGDMLHAPLVGEVATAAAFQMGDHRDPFEGAAQFIGAYHQTLPLTEVELEIIADLVATRHLITVLITEWRVELCPENRAYIMKNNPGAWRVLSQLAEISRDEACDRLLSEVLREKADEKYN
jgi:Ser/Thr protein kinase RdoA (MazF antagonist)